MKKVLTALVIGTLSFQTASAGNKTNACGHFYIQISNLTDSTCVLTGHSVNHGNLISAPAGTIMPSDSKVFGMEQTMIGPEILLSYRCGKESVTFVSKQDLCFLAAGSINGKVVPPTPATLFTNYTTVPGSYFWEKPGIINWVIAKSN
jgi:hypothetical protein